MEFCFCLRILNCSMRAFIVVLFLLTDLNAGVWCQRFNLTKPQGEITSIDSDLDGQYENDRVYKWYIQVEEGSKIRIDVIEIDIEYGYTCEYDLLSFVELRWKKSLGVFCGTTVPPPLTTFGNTVFIAFRSDSTITATGFKLNYTAVPDSVCHVVETQLFGVLRSPDVDGNQAVNCLWTLISGTPTMGMLKNIYVIEVDFQHNGSCERARLEMYGENEEFSDVFCGSDKTIFFTRKSRAVFVEFHSDSTIIGKGFTAIYTMSDPDGLCGRILTNSTNSISAPDRDGDGLYDEKIKCFWAFIAPKDHVIQLEFRDMDLEETENCDFDIIELFDVEEVGSASSSINRFCGDFQQSPDGKPNTFVSSSNIMYMQFFSDESVTGAGFNAISRHIHVDSLKPRSPTMKLETTSINTTTTMMTETTSSKSTTNPAKTGGKGSKPNVTAFCLLAIVMLVQIV